MTKMPARDSEGRSPVTAMAVNPVTPGSYVSPIGRRHLGTSNKKASPRGFLSPLAMNNDLAEKTERQMSKVLEMQQRNLVSPIGGNRRSLPLGGVSNAELTEHYADCIKLSAENRISSKNAFGLHLIDYMSELFKKKDITDFQLASSTLDASAKIYAFRVDAIHSEMYKVLTGLGRGAASNSQKEPNDNDEEESGGAHDVAAGGTNEEQDKKRKRGKKSHTIETNLKNINVNKFDMEYEVDPMFQKTLAAFDDGGTGGLLLNHLLCYEDTCELVLDCNTVVSATADGTLDTDRSFKATPISVADGKMLRDSCSCGSLDTRKICPPFSTFEFMSWNAQEEDSFKFAMERLGKNEHAFDIDAEMEPIVDSQIETQEAGAAVIDDGYGPINDDDDNYAADDTGSTLTADDGEQLGGCVKAFSLQGPETHVLENTIMNVKNGELCNLIQALTSDPSDYAYFKTDLLRTWAGPEHWKLQPRGSMKGDVDCTSNKPTAGDRTGKKVAKVKAAFVIDYDEDIDVDALLKETRAATTVAKATLSKNSRLETTLPEDLHYDGKQLLQLFDMLAVMVKWQTNNSGTVIEVEQYNYENVNDKCNFCPESQEGNHANNRVDDDDDIGDDDDYNTIGEGGIDFNLTSGDYTQTQFPRDTLGSLSADGTMLAGDNLLAPPRKIARIEIDYAKVAKRIDVKRLKSVMWSILTETANEGKNSSDTRSKEKEDDSAKDNQFQRVLLELPQRVPSNMVKNLSVPIVFVCLLHLANEKSLRIENVGNSMSDLLIRKG